MRIQVLVEAKVLAPLSQKNIGYKSKQNLLPKALEECQLLSSISFLMHGKDFRIAALNGIRKDIHHILINIISIEVCAMKNVFYQYLDVFSVQG